MCSVQTIQYLLMVREKSSPLLRFTHLWQNTHQFTDLFLTVRCWSGSCSNHSGSLIVSEFLYASLSCHYVAHLKYPHTKEVKNHNATVFCFFGFFFHCCTTKFLKLATQKTSLSTFEPFFLWPPSPIHRIQYYWKVYLPQEEGMCVSAPVQLVNTEGEDSVKLICACP